MILGPTQQGRQYAAVHSDQLFDRKCFQRSDAITTQTLPVGLEKTLNAGAAGLMASDMKDECLPGHSQAVRPNFSTKARPSASCAERVPYAFHRHHHFRNVPIEIAPVGAEFLQERLDIGGRQPGLVGRATARSGDLLGKDGRQVRKPGLAKQLIGVLVVVTDGLRQTRTGPVRSSRMDADEHIRHEFSNGHMSPPVLILCGDLVRLPQNELFQGRQTLFVSGLDLVLMRIVDPAHFTEISNDISIL